MNDPATCLARRTTLGHPAGIQVETPLLVPSFSSKGFPVAKGRSQIGDVLRASSEWLTETMLVSAYDLGHGHIPKADDLPALELTFVDSGGYEMRDEHDMSAAVHWAHQPLPWDESRYRAVLDEWPERLPACFISYDEPRRRSPLQQQVNSAKDIFAHYPHQLHALLLKPQTLSQQYLTETIDAVRAAPHQLAAFNIIGVTENELGSKMLDRMYRVAKLRQALDRAAIAAPIHVFGALDPLSCVLFFLAGAEVFDGLTWLRYGFRKGLCIYQRDYGALVMGVDARDTMVRLRTLSDNVTYLQSLSLQMRQFLLDRDFDKFTDNAEFFRTAYDSLRTRLDGGR